MAAGLFAFFITHRVFTAPRKVYILRVILRKREGELFDSRKKIVFNVLSFFGYYLKCSTLSFGPQSMGLVTPRTRSYAAYCAGDGMDAG